MRVEGGRAGSQPECGAARPSLNPESRYPRARVPRLRYGGVVLVVPARPQRSLPVGCDCQHHILMCNRPRIWGPGSTRLLGA